MYLARLALIAGLVLAPCDIVLAVETTALMQLTSTRSLKCQFPVGITTEWDSGNPVPEKSTMGDPLIFDSIDHESDSARLIGNAGTADVMLIVTPESVTFLEVTPTGNINITTVFAAFAKDSRHFIAVHSRHVSFFGPLPSQYHGTCESW